MREIIPIVFATDDSFSVMTGIAIYSLIENANSDYDYDIYVLTSYLSDEHQRRIKRLETYYVKIHITDINKYMFDHKRHSSRHLSIETVYRLLIPDILPQYKKVLYLDSDIIIEGDISELYHYEIGDFILGAIHEPIHKWTDIYWSEHLNVPHTLGFNAGIILINTKRFIEEKIKDKCIELLEEDWKREKKIFEYMDQDVLNITCAGKVFFISAKWNFQYELVTEYPFEIYDEYKTDYEEAHKAPKLIHYAGAVKPWHKPKYHLSEIYWSYARRTEFYEELLYANLSTAILDVGRCFETFIFPFDCIERDKKIILYGAGEVGKAFVSQIELTKWCTILLWVDKDYENLRIKGLPTEAPSLITQIPYDFVLIAIENKDLSDSIKNELIRTGVLEKKIIWKSPTHNK